MKLKGIITFAYILTIVGLGVGLSSCERITSIVSDDEMPDD